MNYKDWDSNFKSQDEDIDGAGGSKGGCSGSSKNDEGIKFSRTKIL